MNCIPIASKGGYGFCIIYAICDNKFIKIILNSDFYTDFCEPGEDRGSECLVPLATPSKVYIDKIIAYRNNEKMIQELQNLIEEPYNVLLRPPEDLGKILPPNLLETYNKIYSKYIEKLGEEYEELDSMQCLSPYSYCDD